MIIRLFAYLSAQVTRLHTKHAGYKRKYKNKTYISNNRRTILLVVLLGMFVPIAIVRHKYVPCTLCDVQCVQL